MLIKLRQTEIEEALKMYVAAQGINLTGKHVLIDFTASRGGDGLTADMDITNGRSTSQSAGVSGQLGIAAPVAEEKAPEQPEEEPAVDPEDKETEESPEAPVAGASLFG